MTREVMTSDQFFAIAQRGKVDVPFPEGGNGAVIPIWGQTPTERTTFERDYRDDTSCTQEEKEMSFRERLVADCARNDDGSRIFTADEIKQLGQCHAGLVERLFEPANKLSGFSKQDIEDTVGNSEATRTEP